MALGKTYEDSGTYYAMDLLHFEEAKLIDAIKRPGVSESLKRQWMWQHYAVVEAIRAIYDKPDLPVYITLETVGEMYANMSYDMTGTLGQRYAVVADSLFYYRDIIKNMAA